MFRKHLYLRIIVAWGGKKNTRDKHLSEVKLQKKLKQGNKKQEDLISQVPLKKTPHFYFSSSNKNPHTFIVNVFWLKSSGCHYHVIIVVQIFYVCWDVHPAVCLFLSSCHLLCCPSNGEQNQPQPKKCALDKMETAPWFPVTGYML